jgi:ribosomal protein S18 acetylase RimI-like enzyme
MSGSGDGPGDAAATDALDDLVFRRPTEADYSRVVEVIDEWWGGRRLRQLLPRLWLQHFTRTSWIAEDTEGRLRGFLVAFVSPDDPTTGYVHMIASDPNRRKSGIGRALYEHAFADLAAHGAQHVKAITWPGNRASVDFHRAIGFRVDDGPGTSSIYGTPAYPDYDGSGEDRVVFIRDL